MLKKASKKHASQSKMLDKAVNESVKVEGGPPARDDSGKMGPGSGAHNHGKSSSASPKNSSVSKALLNKDCKPSIGKLKNAIDDVNNTRSMAGNKFDITNIVELDKIFKDIVDSNITLSGLIHFAGLKSVSESFERPIEYWETNVLGTINLIEIKILISNLIE